jgi:DNA-binding transcriptional ArsR family regulator
MKAQANELDEMYDKVAAYFAVLAEPNRLKIMHALCEGERTVGRIVEESGVSQTGVSRHLALMHLHGLVTRRREGKQIHYRIADQTMPQLCRAVCARMAGAMRPRRPLQRQLMKLVAAADRHAA